MPQSDYCSNHVISKEARLTAVMLAIVVAFFICWTPLIVASVLYTSNITTKEFSFVSFSIILRSVNGVVNPIIYGILNKNFRKAYKTICFTMVRFLLCRCHSSIWTVIILYVIWYIRVHIAFSKINFLDTEILNQNNGASTVTQESSENSKNSMYARGLKKSAKNLWSQYLSLSYNKVVK